MRIEKIEFGIHTMELYAKDLKYQEVQKVIDRLTDNGSIRKMRSDPYNIDRHLTSTFLVDDGIRLRIHQSHNKSNGIALIVNPSTLLSRKYQPTKLYHPKKKSCEELLERVGAALIKIGLGTFDSDDVVFIVPPDELSLSQMDLTVNLWFDDETNLEEIIRLFCKGKVPKSFIRQGCLSDEEHQHYFGMSNHTVTFKAYDKIYELEKNGRCPKKLTEHKLLRLEVSLKREAFLKKLGVQRKDCLYKMLRAGFQFVQEIISHYLKKLFPCSGAHVRYKTAKKKILDCVENPVLQDQMLFLLKKTSDGAGMDTAAQKLKDYYKYVKIEQVLDEFEHLGISPISLINNSSVPQLSSIRNLLK